MKVEILGTGCPKCKQLTANVEEIVKELNLKVEVIKVTEINKIIEYGVMMTPALVIDGKVVSAGKVLTKDQVKDLMQTI